MGSQIQTVSALLAAALAAAWLVARAVARRRKPGCGGDCGCASSDLKAKALRRDGAD